MKIIELLDDSSFETGFHLLGINPEVDKRTFYRHLDYDNKALKSDRIIWQMAQWWTPYNVVNASYKEENNNFLYQTPSRLIGVNPKEKKLIMHLSGSKEYPNGARSKVSDPWSHLLIEQDFKQSVNLLDLEKLEVELTFNIEKVIDKHNGDFNPNFHAAQFLWYFVITDISQDNNKYIGYGNFKEFFWFGVPLFDSRHDFISETMHVDQGGIGTTGRLIYSMPNNVYLKEKIEFGKEYKIKVDILPYVIKAKDYALQNGYLLKHDHAHYQIGYMNFGWEIPGMYDVESYIKDMSIKGYLKK
ncbi:MAG TPA: hypothetical protein VK005_02080 [Acholeplasma sp.]|nr:hypothetical protein [Acholeplasma sp.]